MSFEAPLPPSPARAAHASLPYSLDLAAGRPPLECAWAAYHDASVRTFSHEEKRALLQQARAEVAKLAGCAEGSVLWTTGGTGGAAEALYLGLGLKKRRRGDLPARVVISSLEHAAVSKTLGLWQKRGLVEVTTVDADANGVILLDELQRGLQNLRPALCSVTAVCGETGVAQPLEQISDLCKRAGVALHTDAVQAVLKVPLAAVQTSLLTFSGHKLGAIGGVGALCVSGEFDGRAFWQQGAEPPLPSIAALLAAIREGAEVRAPQASVRLQEQLVLDAARPATLLGRDAPRSGNITALHIHGVSGEAVMMALDARGFAVSNGSACSSGAKQPSPVLMSMGLSARASQEVIRLSWPEPPPDAPGLRAFCKTLHEVVSLLRAQD